MTQDDIISMARKAGFKSNSFCPTITRHSNGSWVGVVDELEAFAALIAAAIERMRYLADLIRRLSRDVPRLQSELAAARRELKRMNRKLKKEPCDA